MKLLLPEGWERPKGFSQGIATEGKIIFVAGQVGWDKTETFHSDDFAEQVHQALLNIVAILEVAGAKPEHITRMTWFITDKQEYLSSLNALKQGYQEVMGKHYPTMSVVAISGLIEDRAKVEIEATAVIPN